jgi:hypothetical protein
MKFKKEISIIIEGEIFEDSIDPIDIFKDLKISWKHWWEYNTQWIYGKPSKELQKGRIDKIYLENMEIKNEL